MARRGIFGGTFNPVHNGHLVMALEALDQARLDHLTLIPVALPPHKPPDLLLSGELRLELLRLATSGVARIQLDDREVRSGGVSYTITTVDEVRAEHPADELIFLIGEDSLPDLPKWRDTARLRTLVTFAVASRPEAVASDADRLRGDGFKIELLASTRVGISSTEVRRRCREGLPLHGFVPESVARELARQRAFCR